MNPIELIPALSLVPVAAIVAVGALLLWVRS
jgi:hypothetical protein